MPIRTRLDTASRVRVTYEGAVYEADVRAAIRSTRTLILASGAGQVLIDAGEADIQFSAAVWIELVEAAFATAPDVAAAFVRPSRAPAFGMLAETAAYPRGWNIRSFRTLAEAEAWLDAGT